MYGARFADLWRGCDLESVKAVWAEGLSTMTSEEIRRGINACTSRPFAPTLPEFLALCRQPIDPETAFREACEQMARRESGADKWSHPAIFWAAATIGAFDLRNGAWSGLGKRWSAILAAELAKGEWAEIPARREALPAPGKSSVPPEEARERIAKAARSVMPGDPEKHGMDWARTPRSQFALDAVFSEAKRGNRPMESIRDQLIADGIATEGGKLLKRWDCGQWVEARRAA